jgi:hypothetical protein
MKNIKLFFMLSLIATILFSGCKKSDESYTNISENASTYKSGGTVNMNSDSLHIVHGFGSTATEILYFDEDQALRDWADTTTYGYFFTDILDSISVALFIADERNEFDTLDLNGQISEDYQDILEGMIHGGGSRGATQLFEHVKYLGGSTMIWYPTPYVGRSWNNKASSIQYAAFGCVLCDYRWWGGRKAWFFSPFFGYAPELGSFNDKTTSVWIW